MEEILRKKIEELANRNTTLELVIAILGVITIVGLMSKHFKSIIDILPSLRKMVNWAQRKWFADAIWRKDMMDKLDSMRVILHEQGKKIETIQNEVQYNGGKIVLSDAVKRLEEGIEYNRQVREINDKCSDTMIFKMNREGACYFINDAFLKKFGWQESDVLEFAFENLVHPDDRNELHLKWQKAIDTKTNFKDDQRIKDSKGKYHRCNVHAYPVVVNGVLKKFKGVIEFINE